MADIRSKLGAIYSLEQLAGGDSAIHRVVKLLQQIVDEEHFQLHARIIEIDSPPLRTKKARQSIPFDWDTLPGSALLF